MIPGQMARPIVRNHLALTKHGDPMDSQYRRICDHLRPMVKGRDSLFNEFNGVVAVHLKRSRRLSPDGRESILESKAFPQSQQEAALFALTLNDDGRFQAAGEAFSTLLQDPNLTKEANISIGLFACNKLSTAFRECGRYKDARVICETIIGESNPNRLSDPVTWGTIQKITRIVEAQGPIQRREAALRLIGNLALTMRDEAFRSAEAIEMIARVLEASDGALRDSHLRISLTSILAKLYKDVGHYSLSELLAREVLLLCIRDFGLESLYTLCRGSDLAALLCKRGKLSLAEELCARALNLLEKSQGGYHQDSLKASQRLAYIKLFQGHYDEACARFQDCLAWQLKRLSPQHRHVLSSMSGIGVCYMFQGRLEKGAQFLRRAETGQINSLGKHHPDTDFSSQFLQTLQTVKAKYLNVPSDKIDKSEPRKFVFPVKATEDPHNETAIPPIGRTPSYELFEQALMKELSGLLLSFLQPVDQQTGLYGPPPSSKMTIEDTQQRVLDRELRRAAATGRENDVAQLLAAGADPNHTGGFYGSALHAACFSGSSAIVKMLLKRHANVDTESGIFGTALRAAAFRGHEEIIHQLLDAGADRNGCGLPEKSPLRAALTMGHHHIVGVLVRRGSDKYTYDEIYGTPLHEAAMSGQDQMVKILLDEKTNPDIQAGVFKTAIEASAWAGNAETTRLLLRHDSSLDARFEGKGALDLAKRRGHSEIFQVIKQRLDGLTSGHLKPFEKTRERGSSSAAASALEPQPDLETLKVTKENKHGAGDDAAPPRLIKKRMLLKSLVLQPSGTGILLRERRTQKRQGRLRKGH